MGAYPLDLTEKIVESVKKSLPKAETARRFGVDRARIKRYCKRLDERGALEPSKAPGRAPKPDGKARKLLLGDLEERRGPPTPGGPSSSSPCAEIRAGASLK
jgi:transposase